MGKALRPREELGNNNLDMYPRGVQKWDAPVGRRPQEQRQLCSSQNQSLNACTLLQVLRNSDQPVPCLRQEHALDQFTEVYLMDICLIVWLRHEQRNTRLHEHGLVEVALHREPRPEQPQSLYAQRLRCFADRFYNAHQWDWRQALDVVKDDVDVLAASKPITAPAYEEFIADIYASVTILHEISRPKRGWIPFFKGASESLIAASDAG